MFEIDKIYKRENLHDEYGGNRRGGIASCANYPFIFLFTAKAGEQHGYEDGWDNQNFFHYTGEGQKGDMTFTMGNKALLHHQKNGKEVFLFEFESKGYWKFIDQFELVDFNYFQTPDNTGETRQGIKFKLKSVTGKSKNQEGYFRTAKDYNKPTKTERKGLVTTRVGQGWYRKALLIKWENKCAVTGCPIKEVLIASHIVPWKDSTDLERLDEDNGILLTPNLDALFDKHLISFDDKGEIILRPDISIDTYSFLGIEKNMRLRVVTSGMRKYLKIHREVFKLICESENDF